MVVGFEMHTYTVNEGDRQVELCVKITEPSQQNITTVTFNLTVKTQDGSAGITLQTATFYKYLCVYPPPSSLRSPYIFWYKILMI